MYTCVCACRHFTQSQLASPQYLKTVLSHLRKCRSQPCSQHCTPKPCTRTSTSWLEARCSLRAQTHAMVMLYSKLPHKVRMRLKMQHACLRLPCYFGTCKLCIALNLQLNRRQFTLAREANKHSKYRRDNDYVQKHKTQKQYTLALPTAQNIPGIALATVVDLLTL